jgi:uncharacterized protein
MPAAGLLAPRFGVLAPRFGVLAPCFGVLAPCLGALAWLVGALVLLTGPLTHAAASAPAFPPLTGQVVDTAALLSPPAQALLVRELAAHEAASGNQIVVVTVPSLDGAAIEDYGYRLGRHWGIGQQGQDNGVLLIVALAERQIRIEVGYGLEGMLTDALSWDIIQGRMLPRFREGAFEDGIVDGARAIVAVLGGDYASTNGTPGPDAAPAPEPGKLGALVFWVLVIFILTSSFGGRGRGGGLGRAVLAGAVLGNRGRGRSGGFGGGGFGGGGGGFGGGGASGGW